jgi:hypothetical protein
MQDGMDLDKSLVQPNIDTTWLRPGFVQLVPSTRMQASNDEAVSVEGKALYGVLLKICNKDNSPVSRYYSVSYNSGSRVKGDKKDHPHYNRLMIYGDLMDPPRCFVVICSGNDLAKAFFGESNRFVGVGSTFYICEPNESKHSMSDMVLITPSAKPCLPLVSHRLLDVDLRQNMAAGDQVYFIKNNLHIRLERVEALKRGVSCSGILCDRQELPIDGKGCGCYLTKHTTAPFVIQYDVFLTLNAQVYRVENVRSYRLSCLFLKDPMSYCLLFPEDMKARFWSLRTGVQQMVSYINNHGCWSVVGWLKKGEVADASNNTERVESMEDHIHISSLYPSESNLVFGDQRFQDLRVSADTVDPIPITAADAARPSLVHRSRQTTPAAALKTRGYAKASTTAGTTSGKKAKQDTSVHNKAMKLAELEQNEKDTAERFYRLKTDTILQTRKEKDKMDLSDDSYNRDTSQLESMVGSDLEKNNQEYPWSEPEKNQAKNNFPVSDKMYNLEMRGTSARTISPEKAQERFAKPLFNNESNSSDDEDMIPLSRALKVTKSLVNARAVLKTQKQDPPSPKKKNKNPHKKRRQYLKQPPKLP